MGQTELADAISKHEKEKEDLFRNNERDMTLLVSSTRNEALEEAYMKHMKEVTNFHDRFLVEKEALIQEKSLIEGDLNSSKNEIKNLLVEINLHQATISEKEALISTYASNAIRADKFMEEIRLEHGKLKDTLELRSKEFMEAKIQTDEM